MRVQFTEADLEQQMRVRAVFDPRWLLNPAKVFPLDGRPALGRVGEAASGWAAISRDECASGNRCSVRRSGR